MFCVCLLPTSACILSGPCDWLFSYFCCPSQKTRETSSHCCPPSCRGMFGPRSVPLIKGEEGAEGWSEALLHSLPRTPGSPVFTDLPAWFHPSLMASSWLHWPPAERGCQPTSQGKSSSPPHGRLPGALAAVGLPWASQLWALSCVLPRPQAEGRGRKGKREAAGEGEKGRKGRGLHL